MTALLGLLGCLFALDGLAEAMTVIARLETGYFFWGRAVVAVLKSAIAVVLWAMALELF